MAHITDSEKESILGLSDETRCRLLSRLRMECERFPDSKTPETAEKRLWQGDKFKHVACMRELWNSFSPADKPEWTSLEEINGFAEKMGVSARCVLIPVHEEPRETYIDLDESYEQMKDAVDGLIDHLTILDGGKIDLWVNDDGLNNGMPPNRVVWADNEMAEAGYLSQWDFSTVVKEGDLYTILHGPILAAATDVEGDVASLTDEQAKLVKERFADVRSADKAYMLHKHDKELGRAVVPDRVHANMLWNMAGGSLTPAETEEVLGFVARHQAVSEPKVGDLDAKREEIRQNKEVGRGSHETSHAQPRDDRDIR